MGSGSCKGTRRSARASCLPQSSSWEGQNTPQIPPGTQEGNLQPSLPASFTESEAKAALGDEEPKHEAKNQQNSNPAASHTGSLQHPPHFHLFISKLPTPSLKFPPDWRASVQARGL